MPLVPFKKIFCRDSDDEVILNRNLQICELTYQSVQVNTWKNIYSLEQYFDTKIEQYFDTRLERYFDLRRSKYCLFLSAQ